jgi:UDP-2-acetamido-2,6-beta-L-arabino-hexul-4-ose reductase
MKKRIGITGQIGFVGTHLFNFLGLYKEEFELVPFKDEFFSDYNVFKDWVKQCDVIVHLAAMNRHNDPEVLYKTNIELVEKLIKAMEETGNAPHVLFSSSSQEERDNPYGKSKRHGRELLISWAKKNNAKFTGMVIPNVFGPFGNPFYNSVVATFCHLLVNGDEPKIETDANLQLIYVNELTSEICKIIRNEITENEYKIKYTGERKVSEILETLKLYKQLYLEKGIIPNLPDRFSVNLFNTFRNYCNIKEQFPVKLIKNSDARGAFIEVAKLGVGGQVSYSTTVPGITRGNHFHTRKIERFIVIKGKAVIKLRRIGTDEVLEYQLNGDEPSYVDMPVWYTHNITNVGDEELITIFWINEIFDPNNQDTYFEAV